jgi:hypothetical protein
MPRLILPQAKCDERADIDGTDGIIARVSTVMVEVLC